MRQTQHFETASVTQQQRSVRQAPIVKALVAVENEHIKLERSGAGTYDLSLEMSATGRGFEVTAIFNGICFFLCHQRTVERETSDAGGSALKAFALFGV